MYRPVKASAISIKPKKWDKAYNADKVEAFSERPPMRVPN